MQRIIPGGRRGASSSPFQTFIHFYDHFLCLELSILPIITVKTSIHFTHCWYEIGHFFIPYQYLQM